MCVCVYVRERKRKLLDLVLCCGHNKYPKLSFRPICSVHLETFEIHKCQNFTKESHYVYNCFDMDPQIVPLNFGNKIAATEPSSSFISDALENQHFNCVRSEKGARMKNFCTSVEFPIDTISKPKLL